MTSVNELEKIQSLFMQAVSGEAVDAGQFIQSGRNLSAADSLAVYRGSVRGTLISTLEQIFPVILKLVGNDFFAQMARDYVSQTPSRSANLNDYGADFPRYISTCSALIEYPYLPDVAQLEWLWHRVYHRAETEIFDISVLAEVPAECHGRLIFYPPEAFAILASNYPVGEIWRLNQSDTFDQEFELDQGSYWYLIHRVELQMQILPLSRGQWEFCSGLQSRMPLEDIGQALEHVAPDENLSDLLVSAVTQCWIGGVDIPDHAVE
ncbi:hypothetical protein OLMES_4202 [Oleiphilus messinensis]|uniref:Putative DNA-binding domain-containing protein n=1 Tax=Oleiphilus messinensis TaxID=141451 RepID=A0A1Y0ICF8_9GAMM|nr:DNA-binding domain-containing protein [Oleiphilus messinensis]ARU58218.1 hypothetical protein OLMES_4202 [Oleiphilus messinensis]